MIALPLSWQHARHMKCLQRIALGIGLIGLTACTTVQLQAVSIKQQFAAREGRDEPNGIGQQRMLVPVMVNDQGPFDFMFDTGSTATVLSSRLVTSMGFSTSELPPVRVRGVSGTFTAPTVHVASVQAGELQLAKVRAPVLVGPVLQGLDGILGMQGLHDMKVVADLVNDQVSIVAADGALPDKRYTVLPFHFLARRFIAVDAWVGQVKVKAIIDTGGEQTLGNAPLFKLLVRADRDRKMRVYRSGLLDTTDNHNASLLSELPRITLGKVEILGLPVSFGNYTVFDVWGLKDQPALLLGMDALGMLSELTIDYRRQELQILGP